MTVGGGVHQVYHAVARSKRLASAAALLRNQLDHVVRYHFGDSFKTSEQAEDLLIRTVAPSVRQFIDIGANVGRFTGALLRHASPDCAAVLVEPSTSALEVLRHRFAEESRVEIIPAAAAERRGHAKFYEEPSAGEASTLVAGATRTNGHWRDVQLETVDAIMAARRWESVDFVKIDAEGYDLRVLQGMTKVLGQRGAGIVQFEYNVSWRQAGSLLENAASMLAAFGYELFLLRGDGLYRPNVPRFGEYFAYSNYVAVAPQTTAPLHAIVRSGY